jgi:hypothetical protein
MTTLTIPYKPRAEQKPFHKNRARIRLLRGGVGAGKTIAGAAESIRLAIENPECDGMIVAPSFPLLERVTVRTILRLLPKSLVRERRKVERYIELINGSRIYYGSADRPETLEGSNLAWAWGDEARYFSQEAWEVLLARVRAPSAARQAIILTTTPSRGWLQQQFENTTADVAQFVVPTASNHYLPEEYLATLKASYSEALFRQYVGGEWGTLEHAVFPEFSRDRHVVDLEVDLAHAVDVLFDPGYRRASLLFVQHFDRCKAHGHEKCLHVVGEWHPSNMPTARIVPTVGKLFERQAWRRGTVFTDPAANAANVTVGYSDIDVWEAAGWRTFFPTTPAERAIPNGIEQIRSLIAPMEGAPRLWFSSDLRNDQTKRGIVISLESSEYPEAKHGRAVSDTPIKDGTIDHSRDALRYGVVSLFPPAQSRFHIV